LSQLRRLVSGSFSLAEACAWPPGDPPPEPLALPLALARLVPTLRLTDAGVQRARSGQLLSIDDFLDQPSSVRREPNEGTRPTLWAWTDPNGSPIALGTSESGGFRVRRGFSAELAGSAVDISKGEP
jgi:hypothetical protein